MLLILLTKIPYVLLRAENDTKIRLKDNFIISFSLFKKKFKKSIC